MRPNPLPFASSSMELCDIQLSLAIGVKPRVKCFHTHIVSVPDSVREPQKNGSGFPRQMHPQPLLFVLSALPAVDYSNVLKVCSLFHCKVQAAVTAPYHLADYANVRGVAANANSCKIGTHSLTNSIIVLSIHPLVDQLRVRGCVCVTALQTLSYFWTLFSPLVSSISWDPWICTLSPSLDTPAVP